MVNQGSDKHMRIAIIGGGAAGMMCAASIVEADASAEVFVIDRNDGLGKKVIISGGGRCNVTTAVTPLKTVLTKYPRGATFITNAMKAFPPEKVFAWFEGHGVPLKTQDDLRVFPVSDDGKDIVGVFEQLFQEKGVQVLLKKSVASIEKRGAGFAVYFKDDSVPLVVDKVVLTTGGQAYRQTGSTGDGYAFAMALGHTITPLAPGLNSFTTKESWPAEVSGLSFEQATITARCTGRPHFTGPFLFTHKGISGPTVFALSSLVAFEKYNISAPLTVAVDLFPDMSIDEARAEMIRLVAEHGSKHFGNVLPMVIPSSLADMAAHLLELPIEKRADEVSKKDLNRLVDWIKGIPLSVVGRGAGDEFITAGGVELSEIDPNTMQSKLCPGLFFAGEVMNVDGFTGGFNLQASWATGRLAGRSVGL